MGQSKGYFSSTTEIIMVENTKRDNVVRQIKPGYLLVKNLDTATITVKIIVGGIEIDGESVLTGETFVNTAFYRAGKEERITAKLSGAVTTNQPSFSIIWDEVRDLP